MESLWPGRLVFEAPRRLARVRLGVSLVLAYALALTLLGVARWRWGWWGGPFDPWEEALSLLYNLRCGYPGRLAHLGPVVGRLWLAAGLLLLLAPLPGAAGERWWSVRRPAAIAVVACISVLLVLHWTVMSTDAGRVGHWLFFLRVAGLPLALAAYFLLLTHLSRLLVGLDAPRAARLARWLRNIIAVIFLVPLPGSLVNWFYYHHTLAYRGALEPGARISVGPAWDPRWAEPFEVIGLVAYHVCTAALVALLIFFLFRLQRALRAARAMSAAR